VQKITSWTTASAGAERSAIRAASTPSDVLSSS
jgi:hypothetical protein